MEWVMIEQKWHEIARRMQVGVPVAKTAKISRKPGDVPPQMGDGLPVPVADQPEPVLDAVI